MAIDFMVMPLSRYIAGDFITPAMRFSWDQGIAYSIMGPEGRRELPKDLPFGGAGASERRAAILPMLLEDLRALPGLDLASLWDEGSAAEPGFHRVDPRSYEALLAEADKPSRSLFGLRSKSDRNRPHLNASLFLPCDFETPFAMSSPFERLTGSTARALHALTSTKWSPAAESAVATLREALSQSAELSLPLIVDW